MEAKQAGLEITQNLVFRRCSVRISVKAQAIVSETFVVFLSPSK
jgi:hypothetical protein